MIHWLAARDVAAFQAFVLESEVRLSPAPSGPTSWVALPPGHALPRVNAGEELLVLWDDGPLSLELAAAIEAADRVLCLPGADPSVPSRLTEAPVMPLARWADGCPRLAHRRSPAAWERALRGVDVPGAVLLESRLPLNLVGLDAALAGFAGLRIAGFSWGIQHPEDVLHLSWTAQGWSVSRAGTWWIGTRRSHWPTDPGHLARIQTQWHPDFGDRHTQLVALGGALEIDALVFEPEGWEGAAALPW